MRSNSSKVKMAVGVRSFKVKRKAAVSRSKDIENQRSEQPENNESLKLGSQQTVLVSKSFESGKEANGPRNNGATGENDSRQPFRQVIFALLWGNNCRSSCVKREKRALKRVQELKRCIKSVSTKYVDDIEILVSEDKSPLSNEIKEMVNELAKDSIYNIRFSTNAVNLGYDGNLGAIIEKSKGKFVFFMSDDDALYENCLDFIIPVLKADNSHGVFYAPFVYSQSGKFDRNHGNEFEIEAGEKSASKYIYDSILFSGLIFRKEYINRFDATRFKNYNYFQVYMFLQMLLHYGGYYFSKPSVLCVGDGENAYGLSESSGGNEILANRKSVISNLEFNKTLIKVIRIFDADEGTKVIDSFAKQYSLHSYSGLSIAREQGLKYYNNYWKTFKGLDIKKYPIAYCYYIILLLLGKKCSDFLLSGLKNLLKKQ